MTNTTSLRPAPSVTIALFCYNQESYIKDALESVLKQDYSPLKIIISDDASKDGTVQIIQNIISAYNGPHEISFNQNAQNLGLIKHINYISNSVDTDLLVAAAGDDISLPNRVTEIVKAYCSAAKQPTSIYSSVRKLSPDGVLSDIWTPPIEHSGHSIQDCALEASLIIGASHAWHKSIYNFFGDITEIGAYEDLVIAYRSAILGGLLYIDQPLVNYRTDVGISNAGVENLSDLQKFERYKKIMIPVLNQRRIDSQLIADTNLKKNIIFNIDKKLNSIYLEAAFNQGMPIKELITQAFKSNSLMYLFKLFRRKIKKKLV